MIKEKQTYRLLSWLLLIAFGLMMIVKDTHHHTRRIAYYHSIICVIDGEPIGSNHLHHASYIPNIINDDDKCAICQFQVVKVRKSSLTAYICPFLKAKIIRTEYVIHYLPTLFSDISSRAPPAC